MKKNILIYIFVLLTSPLLECATAIETLKKVKEDLKKGETSVGQAITTLSTSYSNTNNTVIKKLTKSANDLNKPVTLLKSDISSLVPGGIPGMGTMGVRDAVTWYLATTPAQIAVLSGIGVGAGILTFGAAAALAAVVIAAITASIPILIDVPAILTRLIDVLESIQNTLLSVKGTIEPVNEQLNPATDPQKVYAHLQTAQQKFGAAVGIVDKIITNLEKIAAEI